MAKDLTDDADREPTDDTGCTRCDAPLIFLGRRDFHDGGFFMLPSVIEGRTNLEMWACSDCGHVEFFMPPR